tara:strand:- start:786 stop:1103 length:318 start_codon:yes stop_codon:yes gene_type:complete
MEQKFTIVRTREVFRRVDGEIQSSNEDSIYAGFGNDAETAIGDLIEQLAEEEDEDFQAASEDGELDDIDALRSIAIDQVEGEFQIYPGVHSARPEIDPIDTTWSG